MDALSKTHVTAAEDSVKLPGHEKITTVISCENHQPAQVKTQIVRGFQYYGQGAGTLLR